MKYLTYVAFFLTYACLNLTAQNGITLEYDCDSDCIDLSINGGESPYDVVWNLELGQLGQTFQVSSLTGDPEEDNNREDLCAIRNGGTYTAIVTDAFCGVAEATLTVDKCECLDIKLESFENVSECSSSSGEPGTPGGASSACDGSITISVETEESYHISWVGPDGFTANSEEISGLCPGFYRATVKIKGCEKIFAHNICCCNGSVDDSGEIGSFPYPLCDSEDGTTQPISLEGSIADSPNSRIILSVSGGGTIRYKWTGPDGYTSESMNISNLEPGSYSVRAFDGCSEDRMRFRIVNCSESDLSLSILGKDNCSGYSTGLASASVTGGYPPFSYSWSNGSIERTIDELNTGNYCVTVTDASGCSFNDCFSVGTINTEVIGCRVFCDGTKIDDFGDPIFVDNPNNCRQSILVCAKNNDIILGGPYDTFEVVDGGNCNIHVRNTRSGTLCEVIPGTECTRCIFVDENDSPDHISVRNCRFTYCNWPEFALFQITNIDNFGNSVAILGDGEIHCELDIVNYCLDSNDPPSVIEQIIDCNTQDNYENLSCGSEADYGFYQLNTPLGCPNNLNDNNVIKRKIDNEFLENLYEDLNVMDGSILAINQESDQYPPIVKPNISFDLENCNGIINYESLKEYDNTNIEIYERRSTKLLFDTIVNTSLGSNSVEIGNIFTVWNDSTYLLIVNYNYNFNTYVWFEAEKCLQFRSQTIGSLKNTETKVFPNPTNASFKILSSKISESELINLKIFDIAGNEVLSIENTKASSEFSLSDFPSGLYFLEIYDASSNKISLLKIIKE